LSWSGGGKCGTNARKLLIELDPGDTAKLFSFAAITRAKCFYYLGAAVMALQVNRDFAANRIPTAALD